MDCSESAFAARRPQATIETPGGEDIREVIAASGAQFAAPLSGSIGPDRAGTPTQVSGWVLLHWPPTTAGWVVILGNWRRLPPDQSTITAGL